MFTKIILIRAKVLTLEKTLLINVYLRSSFLWKL